MTAHALGSIHDCIDGFSDVTHRLSRDFALTVDYEPLQGVAGHYYGSARRVVVNSDAAFEDQLWLLIQVWQMCAMGPHTVPDARPTTSLRLVAG